MCGWITRNQFHPVATKLIECFGDLRAFIGLPCGSNEGRILLDTDLGGRCKRWTRALQQYFAAIKR
jgi:hypothetical protein